MAYYSLKSEACPVLFVRFKFELSKQLEADSSVGRRLHNVVVDHLNRLAVMNI